MRFYLGHIPLNAQGYDRQGCYYGQGQRLYRAESHNAKTNEFGEVSFELRAKDRDDAKAQVKRKYLEATFWN